MAHTVNTVTGPVRPEDLGKTLMHEHFVFGYPGYAGDVTIAPYDRAEALRVGMEVAHKVQARGVKTVVDPTPNECGRDPELLREISERTGLQIICATGYYFEGEGAPAYFKFRQSLGSAESEIYEMFMTEISEGIGKTGIRPGIIKLASSKGAITDYERMFFRAAAKVQKETGITIVTHTQEGTMGPDQAQLLKREGADPSRIVIGHMDGNTDVAYHLKTLAEGVNIAFDRFGLQVLAGTPFDVQRQAVLLGLIGLGYANKIMLAHDTVNVWLGRPLVVPDAVRPIVENWHVTHVFDDVAPMLERANVPADVIESMFIDNPRRAFGGA